MRLDFTFAGRTALLITLMLTPTLSSEPLDHLAFLSGCWALQSGTVAVEEQWNRPAGGLMLGTSRTLRAGRAVFHEFIRIEQKGNDVFYTPRVGSAPPVSFRAVKLTAEEAVFENLEHDFPQRIIYRKGDGSLPARIEGSVGGALKGQDFLYRRVACP
jgi:hypothetical protein